MRPQRVGDFTVESLMSGIAAGLGSAILDQYDTVTLVSDATPPLSVNLRDATASGPPSPIAQLLRPTVILTGRAGRKVIAPYGESTGSHGGPFLLVLGLVGVGFVLGRLT
jgi:hypothetical protein